MKIFKNASTVGKAFQRLAVNIGPHSMQQFHLLVVRILDNQYQVFGVKNVIKKGNDDYFSYYPSWPYYSLSLF